MTKDGYGIGVTSKGRYDLLDKLKRFPLVVEAVIPKEGFAIEEVPERTKAIINGDEDDIAKGNEVLTVIHGVPLYEKLSGL